MTCDVGIIGLAVMGRNLALNIADKKFQVAVYNRTTSTTDQFLAENSSYKNLVGCNTLEDFKKALKVPRRAIILVQAGAATDAVIEELCKVFERNDIVIDTGNAHFRDQTRRAAALDERGLRFLGMGISGGEEGARKGPAFFPGGNVTVWKDVRDVIEAAAAKAEDGRPCAVMNGRGGAGSCVKMYHNAGEYAILQIWGEVYAVLKEWGVPAEDQANILTAWKTKQGGSHKNLLASYMLDVTVEVVKMKDSPDSGGAADGSLLVERTMDKIGSKGTGLWSVQEAMGVGVPAPSLAEAVLARQMTMYRDERLTNAESVKLPASTGRAKASDQDLEDLYWATALSIIASYAQMFQCLRALDKEFNFGLQLPATISTFRAGCILKGYLLQPMTEAFEADPNLSSLLVAFKAEIEENLPKFRRAVSKIVGEGNALAPVLLASLCYIETMVSENIQSGQCVALQRDVFGRHGFKRVDKAGDFNANWPELQGVGQQVPLMAPATRLSGGGGLFGACCSPPKVTEDVDG